LRRGFPVDRRICGCPIFAKSSRVIVRGSARHPSAIGARSTIRTSRKVRRAPRSGAILGSDCRAYVRAERLGAWIGHKGRPERNGIRPGRVPLSPEKTRQAATRRGGPLACPPFGAVLWAFVVGCTREALQTERPLTIEILSSPRFLEPPSPAPQCRPRPASGQNRQGGSPTPCRHNPVTARRLGLRWISPSPDSRQILAAQLISL